MDPTQTTISQHLVAHQLEHEHAELAQQHAAAATHTPPPRERQLQEQLRARDEEVAKLKAEVASLKALLRRSQQSSAMLVGEMTASVLGSSSGQGMEH